MQSTGQTSTHCGVSKWPTHSVHFDGSIRYISIPCEIAPFGHSGSQTSQLMHSSVIISAMAGLLPLGLERADRRDLGFQPGHDDRMHELADVAAEARDLANNRR